MAAATKIVLTPGEPAGIGPDLVALAPLRSDQRQLIVAADPEILKQRAKMLGANVEWPTYTPDCEHPISILPVAVEGPVVPGRLDRRNATYVLRTLNRAVQGCISGEFDAMVTGPVHKGIINDAGIPFTGHTEYLAEVSQSPEPVMMLVTGSLRVPLVTTHVPLAAVPPLITAERISRVVCTVHDALESRFGIPGPRIAVCGLNPHAGEGGHVGREEVEIIEPTLRELSDKGLKLSGPMPADTVFVDSIGCHFDAIIAMYHDQGLPVLKRSGFGQAVNVTLGLPFLRVSVDHGTALDKAGSGEIDSGSLIAALNLVGELRQTHR